MVVCHTLIYMLPIHLFVYSCFSHMYIFLSIWDDTHIFNASIFHRQLMIIHTLLMHVFYIHLLFVKVFFIVSWWQHTCFFCMYFTYVLCVRLLFVQVFFIVSRWQHKFFLCMYFLYIYILRTLAFCASIFHHQSIATHMFLMHVFLVVQTWRELRFFTWTVWSHDLDDDNYSLWDVEEFHLEDAN